MNDGRNFFIWLIFMVAIFIILGVLETALEVPDIGWSILLIPIFVLRLELLSKEHPTVVCKSRVWYSLTAGHLSLSSFIESICLRPWTLLIALGLDPPLFFLKKSSVFFKRIPRDIAFLDRRRFRNRPESDERFSDRMLRKEIKETLPVKIELAGKCR